MNCNNDLLRLLISRLIYCEILPTERQAIEGREHTGGYIVLGYNPFGFDR